MFGAVGSYGLSRLSSEVNKLEYGSKVIYATRFFPVVGGCRRSNVSIALQAG